MSLAETKPTVICTNPNLAATLNESRVPCISTLDRPIHHYAPVLYVHSPQVVLADWPDRWESSYRDATKDFLTLCKRVKAPSLPKISIPDQRHFYAAVAAGQIVAVAFAEDVLVDIRMNELYDLERAMRHPEGCVNVPGSTILISTQLAIDAHRARWKNAHRGDVWKKWAEFMLGPVQAAYQVFRDVCGLQPGKEAIVQAGLQLQKCFWNDLAPVVAQMPPVPSLSTSALMGLLPLGHGRHGMSGSAGICIDLLPVPEERYECVPSAAGWLSRLAPLFTRRIRGAISTARGPYWTKPGEKDDLFGKVSFEKAVTVRYDVSPRRVHAVPLVLDLIRRWLACAVFIDKGLVLVLPECRDLKAKAKLIRLLATDLWKPVQEWLKGVTQQAVQTRKSEPLVRNEVEFEHSDTDAESASGGKRGATFPEKAKMISVPETPSNSPQTPSGQDKVAPDILRTISDEVHTLLGPSAPSANSARLRTQIIAAIEYHDRYGEAVRKWQKQWDEYTMQLILPENKKQFRQHAEHPPREGWQWVEDLSAMMCGPHLSGTTRMIGGGFFKQEGGGGWVPADLLKPPCFPPNPMPGGDSPEDTDETVLMRHYVALAVVHDRLDAYEGRTRARLLAGLELPPQNVRYVSFAEVDARSYLMWGKGFEYTCIEQSLEAVKRDLAGRSREPETSPVTLKQFMECYCEPMTSQLLTSRLAELQRRSRHGAIVLPACVGQWSSGKSKYFRAADLCERWSSYRTQFPALPKLKSSRP